MPKIVVGETFHFTLGDIWYAAERMESESAWEILFRLCPTLTFDPTRISTTVGYQYETGNRRRWPDKLAVITKADKEGVEALVHWGRKYFKLKTVDRSVLEQAANTRV